MNVSGGQDGLAVAAVDLLATIVSSAPDAIVGQANDGTVLVWNRAAEHLYGCPAAEMVGRRAELPYTAERHARNEAALPRVANDYQLNDFDGEHVLRDGTRIRVRVRAAPLIDDAGGTIGVATWSSASDGGSGGAPAATAVVLDRRMSHKLRTPLNAIIGFTGTLLMRLPGSLNEDQEHQLRLVQASAQQLLSTINQMSRSGDG